MRDGGREGTREGTPSWRRLPRPLPRLPCLRVAAPTVEEVSSVLLAVAHKEGVKCPPALAERIARASDRNLRRATLMLQASHARQYPFSADQQVELPDWEAYITTLSREISQEQTPQRLLGAKPPPSEKAQLARHDGDAGVRRRGD